MEYGFDPHPEHTMAYNTSQWYDTPHAPIAQSVEQSPLKRTVVGSNPTRRTNEIDNKKALILRAFLYIRHLTFYIKYVNI